MQNMTKILIYGTRTIVGNNASDTIWYKYDCC